MRTLRVLATGGAHGAIEIAKEAGLTPQGARLVLDGLASQGLVKVLGSARTQLFHLDSAHPLADPITALFRAEADRWLTLLTRIRDKLASNGAGVKAAWLYGSVARGEDTSSSDIDIALLVSSGRMGDKVREDLMPIESEHQVTISVTALTAAELAAVHDDDLWWSDVVRDGRVLIGSSPAAEKKRLTSRQAAAK